MSENVDVAGLADSVAILSLRMIEPEAREDLAQAALALRQLEDERAARIAAENVQVRAAGEVLAARKELEEALALLGEARNSLRRGRDTDDLWRRITASLNEGATQ